jgi:enoyl-CoA hydratase/carnithine racemase
MELNEVRLDKHDGVAEIVLQRPDVLNALSAIPGGTRDQLVAALEEAGRDPLVGCVVLRGEGRAFCGGGDLTNSERREHRSEHLQFLEQADQFHDRIQMSAVPTVAAVHGYCLGAGVALATSCDLVVAADNARFGFPEARIGLVGASATVAVIGRQWAKFLMLTGELLDAEQARDIGLVLTVEPASQLVERALDLAIRIGRMPREAAMLNRRTIDAVADAAGEAARRDMARAHDADTLAASDRATLPDGRRFREILDQSGIAGLKAARAGQYTEPWLRQHG